MVTQSCNILDLKVDVNTFMRSLTNAVPLRFFSTTDDFVEIENVFVYLTPQKTYLILFVFRTYIILMSSLSSNVHTW